MFDSITLYNHCPPFLIKVQGWGGGGGDTGIDFLLLLSGICLRKGLIFLISGGEFLFSTGLLAVLVMTCYLTVKVYILVSLSSHLVWGNDI